MEFPGTGDDHKMKLGELIEELMQYYEEHGDVPVLVRIQMEDRLLALIATQAVKNSQNKKSIVIYGGL